MFECSKSFQLGQFQNKQKSKMAFCFLWVAGVSFSASFSTPRIELSRPSDSPNFLVILVDDWSYSDLEWVRADDSPWNDMPVVDDLARRGQSWTQFYAQPLCNQTRQSLMLGRFVGSNSGKVCAVPTEGTPAASSITIASNLQSSGYSTAVFGKWHVGPNPNESEAWELVPGAYGFDQWRAFNASNLLRHCQSKDYTDWYRIDDGKGRQTQEYHTTAVARAAREWWQETDGKKFAYVCFQAPHSPFHFPPRELLPEGYPEPMDTRQKYESMLVAMDSQIGEILEVVDLEKTFVLILGDNGTPAPAKRPDNKLAFRSKGTVYQDGIHVPLIVAGPRVAQGKTNALGHVADLLATLGELASAPDRTGTLVDSISLAPVFFDPEVKVRDYLICDLGSLPRKKKSARKLAVIMQSADGKSMVKGLWKMTQNDKILKQTFYDLSLDPKELSPLPAKNGDYSKEFKRIFELRDAYIQRDLDIN